MEHYKFFIQDLVTLLKERLQQEKENQAITNDDFNKGVSMGIYESLDLIKKQAESFNIPLSEIGLDDFSLKEFL